MKIRAFNLVPGARIAVRPGPDRTVCHVERDSDLEVVRLRFVVPPRTEGDGVTFDTLTLDFNTEVALLGLSPNHGDPDETDFGAVDVTARPF